jgi:NADH-quinone oxidoreductase subunit M
MLVSALIVIPFLIGVLMLVLPQNILRISSIIGALGMLAMTLYAYTIVKVDDTNPLLQANIVWISSMKSNWDMALDGISLLMVFLTTLLAVIIFATIRKTAEFTNSFYASAWTMVGAMIGVFCTRDGLMFYVFWELALIPIYFICVLWGGENREKITFKFFAYTLFGSLFMLAALLYLYNHSTDGWSLSALAEAGSSMTLLEQNLVFWGIFIGFAIKMPVFPFHTWQPDTYSVAPTQGTMLLSGIMLKMSTYGVFRWLLPLVPMGAAANTNIVVWLAVGGLVYASIIALLQKDLKRMMAWSSIAHVGLIAAGLFINSGQSLNGAFIQMLSHGINVVACFYVVDILATRFKTTDMSAMGGIRGVNPLFGFFFLVILLGSIALPLTNGFVGEFMLISGTFSFNPWLALTAGLSVILGAVYMLRAYQTTMLGLTNELTQNFEPLTWNEKINLSIFVVLIIAFGIFPNAVLQLIGPYIDGSLAIK